MRILQIKANFAVRLQPPHPRIGGTFSAPKIVG